MFSEAVKELARTKAQVAILEETIVSDLDWRLSHLPKSRGFAADDDFLSALKLAIVIKRGRPGKTVGPGPRKRTVTTNKILFRIRKQIAAGKTDVAIAKNLALPLPVLRHVKTMTS